MKDFFYKNKFIKAKTKETSNYPYLIFNVTVAHIFSLNPNDS